MILTVTLTGVRAMVRTVLDEAIPVVIRKENVQKVSSVSTRGLVVNG